MQEAHADRCADCTLGSSRRTFLQNIGLGAIAALVSAGLPAPAAATLRVSPLRPTAFDNGDPSYPLPAEDGAQLDAENMVILVRWQGVVVACSLACPHQRTALEWSATKSEFECPKHHSRFQPTGLLIEGRAKRNIDRYELTRAENVITVLVSKIHRSDDDAEGWAKAVLQLQP